uniref:Uncharacterized protein n=1 Tax=Nelumbo nucifera TaxID=4432 RepID=A0A822Y8G2_NELNU|nr:TPA_asm: hypothetical protein HUJ06_029057 [Nelumbo nucifera]
MNSVPVARKEKEKGRGREKKIESVRKEKSKRKRTKMERLPGFISNRPLRGVACREERN